ncbi:MAG: apolipoprotein N-acyltransferase, partial [Bacteroidota bacterium]
MQKIREKNAYLFMLSLLGGVLLGLGWRLSPWLLFFAWIPFLELDMSLSQKKPTYGNWIFAGLVFLGLIIWHLLALPWLFAQPWLGAILLIIFNCLLMLIPFILFRITRRAINEAYGYFSLVLYWISLEFLNLHWGLAWPWLTLGNALAPLYYFIQWYEITGVLGG